MINCRGGNNKNCFSGSPDPQLIYDVSDMKGRMTNFEDIMKQIMAKFDKDVYTRSEAYNPQDSYNMIQKETTNNKKEPALYNILLD